MRGALACLALAGAAPVGAMSFNPGPWVVFFERDGSYAAQSDRWLLQGIARLRYAGVLPKIDLTACAFGTAGARTELDANDRIRIAKVARLVAAHAGLRLRLAQHACAGETDRPLPGVLVAVMANATGAPDEP